MSDDVAALLDGFAAHLADPAAPPPALDAAAAAAISDVLHAELDRGTVARAEAARAMGHPIACHAGCASCCRTILVTAEPEALSIARWLAAPAQQRARAGFLARHATWRVAGAALIDRAAAASVADDRAGLAAAMGEATRADLMCPFNDAGACSVYPVRPWVCRVAHAVDTHQDCQPGRRARGLDFVPITRFLARLRPLEAAMQRALPSAPAAPAPLADRVATLLAIT